MIKNVMLGMLILQKYIQKELHGKIKTLLMILIVIELSFFLCEKKILARLKKRTIFALTCFVMEISWFFQSTFQIKNLKTRWIYYWYLTAIYPIMCTSNILTDLCFRKRRIKTKNNFVRVANSLKLFKTNTGSI